MVASFRNRVEINTTPGGYYVTTYREGKQTKEIFTDLTIQKLIPMYNDVPIIILGGKPCK